MMDNLLAWVCPVARGFADVQRRLGFSFVAADVIDDQRQWPMHPAWRAQIERDYAETFAVTDVAFANCQPVGDWLACEGLRPHLVPNGMEIFSDVDTWSIPPALAALPRPIIGYCGNLTQRLDWELIDAIARLRPQCAFVLIGEPPAEEGYRRVIARPNVHVLGVLPHTIAQRHIAAFDAAMIPHLASTLSDHMNPLKLYVYRALGVPVVSTPVANLDDLKDDISIAASADAFTARLDEAVQQRRRGRSWPDPARMRECSWDSRAEAIWSHVEDEFDARRESKGGRAA